MQPFHEVPFLTLFVSNFSCPDASTAVQGSRPINHPEPLQTAVEANTSGLGNPGKRPRARDDVDHGGTKNSRAQRSSALPKAQKQASRNAAQAKNDQNDALIASTSPTISPSASASSAVRQKLSSFRFDRRHSASSHRSFPGEAFIRSMAGVPATCTSSLSVHDQTSSHLSHLPTVPEHTSEYFELLSTNDDTQDIQLNGFTNNCFWQGTERVRQQGSPGIKPNAEFQQSCCTGSALPSQCDVQPQLNSNSLA